MSILKQIAERIDKLENARHIVPNSPPIPSRIRRNQKWIEALENNNLIFDMFNRERQFHIPDFKKIDFTGPELNHQEWRAQLNRFFWVRPLTYKYIETGDKRYAQIVRDTIEAWFGFHENKPYLGNEDRFSIRKDYGDNTLSISVRLGQCRYDAENSSGWWGAVPYLEESGIFDDGFVNKMLDDAADKLEFLKQNLSKTGNWRMSELDCLFFCGYVLPGMEEYARYAVKMLNEAFRNQFEPDGSHCEHTANYHNWMKRIILGYSILAKNMPELGLDIDSDMLMKIYKYSIHTYAPDGRSTGLNDSAVWNKNAIPADLNKLCAEYLDIAHYFDIDIENPPIKPSGWFFNAGQFYLRDSWSEDGTMFIFDNTADGGWHTHAGRNAVYLYHGKRMILCDPGSINYDETFDPFSAWGCCSFMHNTVTLSGMTQVLKANANVRYHYESDRIAMINSIYSGGYFNETASRIGHHTRTFLWVKGKFALVLDAIDAGLSPRLIRYGEHPDADIAYESHWQFGDEQVVLNAADLSAHTIDEGGNMYIKAIYSSASIEAKLYSGCMSPVRGFIAETEEGSKSARPAPKLVFEGRGKNCQYIAQIIVPFEGTNMPKVTGAGEMIDGALHLVFEIDGEAWNFAINGAVLSGDSKPTMIGDKAELKSDAMIAITSENSFSWIYNGKYLAKNDKIIIEKDKWGNWKA